MIRHIAKYSIAILIGFLLGRAGLGMFDPEFWYWMIAISIAVTARDWAVQS